MCDWFGLIASHKGHEVFDRFGTLESQPIGTVMMTGEFLTVDGILGLVRLPEVLKIDRLMPLVAALVPLTYLLVCIDITKLRIPSSRIAKGTVKGPDDRQGTQPVPTVTDTYLQEEKISEKIIGISFEPVTAEGEINGELTFGFVNDDIYTGSLNTM